MIEKYEFWGEKDGLSLLVLGAVHGNETAGTKAIRRILEEFESGVRRLKVGHMTVVPVCNSEAYNRDIRQVEENLNRVMVLRDEPKTYEQRIANEIVPLIANHRVLLDLHSTHCKGDVPFAFCDYPDAYNEKLIAGLPVGYVLEGWPDIYANQGDITDYSTERAAHTYGNTGTTLECGYHKEPAAAEVAYSAILNTLAVFGMVEASKPVVYSKQHILMKNYVVKTRAGRMLKNYKHLDLVYAGEELARYDDGEVLTASSDGYILLPNLEAEIGAEWYYFGIKKP